MLLLHEQFPINKLCAVLGVPRSSAYYEPRPDEDRPLLDALIEVAGQGRRPKKCSRAPSWVECKER